MGILRLDVTQLGQFLPPQFGGRLHGGYKFLAERLHTLAVQGILPALGRLLEVASAEPTPLRVGVGVHGHEHGPQASGLSAQRLTLNQGGVGETTQGDEAHNA
jgi:hypothetical protein